MNLDPSYKKGSHWIAVYIDDDKDKSVEYYDSYGEEPPKSFEKDIKKIIDKMKTDTYLKFKINRIVDQRNNSSNCGFFAMKFILDRMSGIPFKDCTGYSNVLKGEKDIKQFKKSLEKFKEI